MLKSKTLAITLTPSITRSIPSSFFHSHLSSIISVEGKQRFQEAVKVDNHGINTPELKLRQGPPNPAADKASEIYGENKDEKRTFKAGEGSAQSPYFRNKKSGDSAVLIPMVNIPAKDSPSNDAEAITQPWLLLTHRSYELRSHRGEICFPGGRIEDNEPIEEAALRESFEEINLPPAAVEIWAELRPSLTRNLKNNVTPLVGLLDYNVLPQLQPRDDEVQTIFLVPLSDLISSRQYTSFKTPKFKYILPVFFSTNYQILANTPKAYHFPDHRIRIWGLTAVMTNQTIGCLLPDEVYRKSYA
uniref:Nudix hydrolase domain-containing protein n=1 Tax=Panagrolaimus sp. ES5 TaxID=591445 RepID=A0AC34F399_9BILA